MVVVLGVLLRQMSLAEEIALGRGVVPLVSEWVKRAGRSCFFAATTLLLAVCGRFQPRFI